MTDKEIVEIISSNEMRKCEDALRLMYKEHYYLIENMVLSSNGTREDAKDIFQDAIVAFYNNVKSGKYVLDSKISTYLFAVSRNLWLKRLRKKGREAEISEEQLINFKSEENIFEDIKYSEEQKLIAQLFMKVGDKCKNLLMLYYYEKMRMKNIAIEMKLSSEQAAKNQKLKCMKKLKAFVLQNEFYSKNLNPNNV